MDKALLHWRSCGGGKQANLCKRHFYAPITIRHIYYKTKCPVFSCLWKLTQKLRYSDDETFVKFIENNSKIDFQDPQHNTQLTKLTK